MTKISVDAASVITEISKSTWRRRIADGSVARLDLDGKRAMLALSDVAPHLIALTSEDAEYLVAADAGSAEAQDDVGQLFLAAGKHEAAIYWLELAAKQDHPNAMQCLGRCYLAGEGVAQDDNMGLMWIAKAAAHGHVIAKEQMQSLHPTRGLQ